MKYLAFLLLLTLLGMLLASNLSPAAAGNHEESSLSTNDNDCREQTARTEAIYRKRYLDSLQQFTEALKQKNLLLATREKELRTLRQRLEKEDEQPAKPQIVAASVQNNPDMTIQLTADFVNLRRQPFLGAEPISQGLHDDQYPYLSATDQWYEIVLDDGQTAWVSKRFARQQPPTMPNTEPQPPSIRIAVETAKLHAGPGLHYPVTGTRTAGNILSVYASTENWLFVKGAARTGGWLHRKLGRLLPEE